MHAIAVSSAVASFWEGCYHLYAPHAQSFPGTVLGTGMEDYFGSAFGFSDGPFRTPTSGCTHKDVNKNHSHISAYRFVTTQRLSHVSAPRVHTFSAPPLPACSDSPPSRVACVKSTRTTRWPSAAVCGSHGASATTSTRPRIRTRQSASLISQARAISSSARPSRRQSQATRGYTHGRHERLWMSVSPRGEEVLKFPNHCHIATVAI